MAEKEGFEPSKLPLFKGKIEVGVYLVCAFVHFSTLLTCAFVHFSALLVCVFPHFSKIHPHLPFRSRQEYVRSGNDGRTVLCLFCVPSPIEKCA